MTKAAQLKQPMVIIIEPLIASWTLISSCFTPLDGLLLDQILRAGPLTRVIIIAPPNVATVPMILAWLRMLLSFIFSSLFGNNHTKQMFFRLALRIWWAYQTIKQVQPKSMKLKLSYLSTQAITNVIAGTMLTIVAANVAEVCFIPKKYKFWSITGLNTWNWKIILDIFGVEEKNWSGS